MKSSINKTYWNQYGKDYSRVWESKAKSELLSKELNFITSYLKSIKAITILDIGVGNGRILTRLNKESEKNAQIYGIDISDEMVRICKDLFKDKKKIKQIKVCDVSREDISINTTFDFVTTIRVLKYNKNWREIIKKIYKKLNKRGVFIFTMPNIKSVSRLHKDKFSNGELEIQYTDIQELYQVLQSIGFQVLEIRSLSRIPNFFYDLHNSDSYVKTILGIESLLDKTLGTTNFGRELFIACQK
jgi:2-polyprenyl-3-methyl-5-hydroxy-6-metoxy-1,4-benzoquinol methylase